MELHAHQEVRLRRLAVGQRPAGERLQVSGLRHGRRAVQLVELELAAGDVRIDGNGPLERAAGQLEVGGGNQSVSLPPIGFGQVGAVWLASL